MPKLIQLVGQVFGKLTVVEFSHRDPPHTYWVCECSCGGKTVASTNNLRRGRHASCGCGHGLSRTPEYIAWYNMLVRCGLIAGYAPAPAYKDVVVHPAYEYFENFLADMGTRPTARHSIDRVNPNGGYVPGNLRWATQLEQGRNKRRHSLVTLPDGRSLRTWEYGEELGVSTKQAWTLAKQSGYLQQLTTENLS